MQIDDTSKYLFLISESALEIHKNTMWDNPLFQRALNISWKNLITSWFWQFNVFFYVVCSCHIFAKPYLLSLPSLCQCQLTWLPVCPSAFCAARNIWTLKWLLWYQIDLIFAKLHGDALSCTINCINCKSFFSSPVKCNKESLQPFSNTGY